MADSWRFSGVSWSNRRPAGRSYIGLPPAIAKIVTYENDRVVAEVSAPPGGGWLGVNEVWDPWWVARGDGEGGGGVSGLVAHKHSP